LLAKLHKKKDPFIKINLEIVAIAYNVLFSTGMFPDACRDWRRCPILEQTWAMFKIDFALAHQELRDSQVTSNQAGYQQAANAAYDTPPLTTSNRRQHWPLPTSPLPPPLIVPLLPILQPPTAASAPN
jgi:hypothetical protein